MKKFALKQSLESTDFLDLQALVRAAMEYTQNCAQETWAEGIAAQAEAFCEMQDAERKEWEKLRKGRKS